MDIHKYRWISLDIHGYGVSPDHHELYRLFVYVNDPDLDNDVEMLRQRFDELEDCAQTGDYVETGDMLTGTCHHFPFGI